jgi:hypothetical protein
MPKRPLVIDVSKDIPARAKPLSAEAISEVFGGCHSIFKHCLPTATAQSNYWACCPGYRCVRYPYKHSDDPWDALNYHCTLGG